MQTQAFAVHEPSGNIEVHGPSEATAPGVIRPMGTSDPGLTTTVPREFVHRAAVAEVLLTGWEAVPESEGRSDCYVVRAQWPRGHSLFAQSGGYQDAMLLVESVRQIGSLLAHAEFGVPFGHQFMMRDIAMTATPDLLLATPTPTEVELRTQCRDVVRRGRTLTDMRYDVTALIDGVALATASASFRCISPGVYRRLRSDRPTGTTQVVGDPIDPATVGRCNAENVVLTEEMAAVDGRRSWGLRINSTHPIFFDHPVDHIPGMVLLEAARQAAHAVTGRPDKLVTGICGEFTRYAELDAPCRVEAVAGVTVAGETPVRVTGVQEGETVFAADVTLSSTPR